MVDVVGLRFVTQGEQQALRALELWRGGLIQTQNVQDRHVAAMNRAANEQIRGVTNVMRMRARAAREAEQAVQREARAVEQAARREAAAIARRDAEDRRAFQAYLRAQQERERAARRQARAAEQTAQREAAATAQLARETESLARAYNPVMAASAVYERRVEEINRAHQIGVLTSGQMRAELTRLQAAYTEVGADAARASAFVNNFSAANTFASRRVNHAGMAYQQVGYQVGDFLVQVQSGTNAFVAFGQQATQLVGILPAFGSVMGVSGTALIALSAGLGIAIPLLTAAGALFMRTRRDADEAAEGVDRLASQIQALDSALQDYMDTQRALRLGVTVEELTGLDAAREAEESLRAAREELQRIRDLQDSLARAPGPEAPFMAIFARRQESARADAEAAALEAVIAAENRLADLRRKQAEEQFATFSERLQQYRDEQELQIAILRFGEDSGRVRRLRAQQALAEELRRIDSMREAQDITEAQAAALAREAAETARLADAAESVLDAFRESESFIRRIVGHDIASGFDAAARSADVLNSRLALTLTRVRGILGALGSLQFDTIGLQAEARALRAGRSEGQARIEAELAQTEARMRQAGPLGLIENAGLAAQRAALEARLRAQEERDALVEASRPARGGRGARGGSTTDPIEQARAAVDRLRASYDEQYATMLRLQEAQNTVNEAVRVGAIDATTATQVMRDYAASLQDVKNPMVDFAEYAARQMSDAFLSVVNGSRSASDAFRDMARAILEQAFRLSVVNPIINSIFGGVSGFTKLPTLFANGGAFEGGRVTAFADGGIVGGPTLFPMRGGTGLMGEAGPEAIMPLKRTSGGKLGVVAEGTQRLNVTVTMDPSTGALGAFVRNESGKVLAAAAPRIVDASVRTMTDTVRRGGTAASVFR